MAKDHEASTDCCWGPKEKFGEGGGKWEGVGKLLCGGGRCVARGVRGFHCLSSCIPRGVTDMIFPSCLSPLVLQNQCHHQILRRCV